MAALGKTAVIDNPEVNDSPQPIVAVGCPAAAFQRLRSLVSAGRPRSSLKFQSLAPTSNSGGFQMRTGGAYGCECLGDLLCEMVVVL